MENSEQSFEATTPTDEAEVQTAEQEPIDAKEEETASKENEDAKSTENTEQGEEEANTAQELLKIRYMHEDVDIPIDEAKRLAQMGKHFEDNVKGTLDQLDYVATLQGKSVKELVESLVNGVDNAYREELISELGEDNPLVEEMLELRRSKNDKAYEKAKAERSAQEKAAEEEAKKSVTTRLAEQFESIREIFPEYDTVEKVPDTVIKRAIKSGDLEKEMLRYERLERQKVEAALASQEKNKNNNIGSIKTGENESGIMDAFLKGIRG